MQMITITQVNTHTHIHSYA